MPIFKLPLFERRTQLSHGPRKRKYKSADGIGFLVSYNKGDDLNPKNIRRHMKGIYDDFCYIKADNVGTAITKFHTEWKGAMVGEAYKALVINKERPILKYPDCPRQTCSQRGEFWCDEVYNEEGNPPGCVLSECDPPDPQGSCPIDQFLDNVRSGEQILRRTVIVVPYGEFLLLEPRPVLAIVSMK